MRLRGARGESPEEVTTQLTLRVGVEVGKEVRFYQFRARRKVSSVFELELGVALSENLENFDVHSDLGEGYPKVVILHRTKGAIAVAESSSEDERAKSLKKLKVQFRALREDFQSGKSIPHSELVVISGHPYLDLVADINALPDITFDMGLLEEFASELRPEMNFHAVLHNVREDDGRVEREVARVRLDAAQEDVAMNPSGEVTVLTGPAGSGKSLVLLARARMMALKKPDWRIQVMCFNRALVPFLADRLDTFPNVSVNTFGSWMRENGYRLNMTTCEASWVGFEKAKRSGIPHSIDLLLVDEFQDFCSAWLALLLACLTPGRGGAILAGDEQQRLYRDLDLAEALEGRDVAEQSLKIPYRSTRQILEIVEILDPQQAVPGIDHAPTGNPVEIVWSEATLQDKANAVSGITKKLMGNGFLKGDIAVLVTNKYMIGTITAILNESDIKAEARYSNKIEADDLAWSNSVKVMTIHSAKGLEFSAVLLVGLDDLKSPDQGENNEERVRFERFARLNLVGPTRAKDLLFIFASRENIYIRRVKERASNLEVHHWPEDYRQVTDG